MNRIVFIKKNIYIHRFEIPIWILIIFSGVFSIINGSEALRGLSSIGFGCVFILWSLTNRKHQRFYYKAGHFKDGKGPKGKFWDWRSEMILYSSVSFLSFLLGIIMIFSHFR